jgi:mannitol-1-/sugar-/sorbitol-6-phosphatase
MTVRNLPAENAPTIQVNIAVGGLMFDMDGVLVRSTQGDERYWTRWATHHNLSETFDLRRTHGRRGIDTVREYFPNMTVTEINDHLAQLASYVEEEGLSTGLRFRR